MAPNSGRETPISASKLVNGNQEAALQLKSAHLIMCFDCAACPTAHKWCQLDAVQVWNFDARRQVAATAAAAAAAAHLRSLLKLGCQAVADVVARDVACAAPAEWSLCTQALLIMYRATPPTRNVCSRMFGL